MNAWERLVDGLELAKIRTARSRTYYTSKERAASLDEFLHEGWIVESYYGDKRFIKFKKEKNYDEIFEDKVWMMFANLGFTTLNKDRYFKMHYDSRNPNLTKQIDVFAVDDETIIFVECKASKEAKASSFKTEIESYGGMMPGLISEARKKFPNRKVKFIFATSQYKLSQYDRDRIESFKMIHFNEDIISYYMELAKHLGSAAKYQLLGNLFAGQTIKNLETAIPAIEGKMGGFRYYAFSIEPEKLLKLGYVLHRNEANRIMMPTYQRLIKKKRLADIKEFIRKGGYFPNSIIVSIDTNDRKLTFDLASNQCVDSLSKIGVLHLPKRYRSVYIIDGQHRLYAYSDLEYAYKNTVPVVAFVDLDREEQVKLFMEINENQKTVSKNLRNTLNADMLWVSNDYNQRIQALRLNIAQYLGEEIDSPLYGRILIGETEGTSKCCITIDNIQQALRKTAFFNTYGKDNMVVESGTFDKGNNESTRDYFYLFLKECFDYLKANLEVEWEKGSKDDGILTINTGIYGLIRVISDIIDLLIINKNINPKAMKLQELMAEVKYYLDPIIIFYNNISVDDRTSIKKSYGGGAQIKHWRYLQKAINKIRPEFNPLGMEEWWINNARLFNDESSIIVRQISSHLNRIFAEALELKYGDNWIIKGIPQNIYTKIKAEADKQDYERIANGGLGEAVKPWSCASILDYREIALYGRNWSECFSNILTLKKDGRRIGNKNDETGWLEKLNIIYNKTLKPSLSITKDEHNFLCSIKEELI